MKKETKIKTFGITAILISSFYLTAYVVDNEYHSYPVNDQFVNGQILPPDVIHSDSLVVINADLLNDEIGNCNGADGSYNDLLGEGTVNIEDYEDYMNVVKQ